MYNLYANFVKIIDVCKSFSKNLVNGAQLQATQAKKKPPGDGNPCQAVIVHYELCITSQPWSC
jgi:hypothetical protein